MAGRVTRSLLVALLAGALLAGAAACGTSPEQAQRERERAAEAQRLRKKAAGLREEIAQLKDQQAQLAPGAATTPAGQGQGEPGARGASRPCGAGVEAGRGTSCLFALNTAQEWVDTSAGTIIQVYEPRARKTYTMKCFMTPSLTTCRGARGAAVYIR